jgi:hypothetical protein
MIYCLVFLFYLAKLFVISRRVGARMNGLKQGKKLPPF